MIYVTGDLHLPLDVDKFRKHNFPEQKNMTKDDYVIICGDAGFCWNNSKEELEWRNWFNNKSFTTLFVDGNHENFDLLKKFPVKQWNGGNVQFINDSIIHLMRGQIFTIQGKTFFTMGGADSVDKHLRYKGFSWWEEEMPLKKEFNQAMKNLDKHNWKVDYVLTHTAPISILEKAVDIWNKDNNPLNSFFENCLISQLEYKHWFFGHFHFDIDIDEKHTLVYDRVVKIL